MFAESSSAEIRPICTNRQNIEAEIRVEPKHDGPHTETVCVGACSGCKKSVREFGIRAIMRTSRDRRASL